MRRPFRGSPRTEKVWWLCGLVLVLGAWFVPLLWGSTYLLDRGRVVGVAAVLVGGGLYLFLYDDGDGGVAQQVPPENRGRPARHRR